ncbi:hypothetical protein CC77DRAFT_1096782 [Alternaria alternata]|uniref:Uncharacterized protein n=1 Tax=Alternaria alternata TaxID=5599 RepID=A0A177DED6_ALTAL|nr:hypothetical protein CC77DRAFT_1096782 [Alternaria alternata]OAG18204.1 hypothetical protein CC77DRAFT_1096782 [Alternaria alternata]
MGTDGVSLPRGLLLLLVGLACALLQYACPAQTNSLESAPSMTAFMAAGIVFIVYVQRKAIATPYQVLMFEAAKSVLATGLWLWLILDSAFGPWRVQHHDHAPDTYVDPDYVKRRVQHDALASLLLIVFFYPPLGYSYIVWRTKSSHGGGEGEERLNREERAPLLSRTSGRVLG